MPYTTAPSSPMSHAPTSPHTPTTSITPCATPPISPRATTATPNRLVIAPASAYTPQCAIPSSPHTPGRTAAPPATPHTPRPEITLRQPSQAPQKRGAANAKSAGGPKALRAIRALFRFFPLLAPACRPASALPRRSKPHDGHAGDRARVTGTFYGHRRARITLAIQEKPGSLPSLVLELAMPTGKLMQEIGSGGHVRIALECEKKPSAENNNSGGGGGSLLEEALWTAYVNGRRVGYAVRREATDDDLVVMQLLSTVSVGAGVLPGKVVEPTSVASVSAGPADGDGEVAYMRAGFDRVVGSKDSESFYMVSPDGGGAAGGAGGPELSIFFVRV